MSLVHANMCCDGAAVLLLLASGEIQKFRSHESRVEHLRMVRYLIIPALQAVVFGFEHDAILRAHLKRRADVKACCSGPGLQEILVGIAAHADKEYGKKDDDKSKAAAADEEELDVVMTIPVLADLPEIKKLVKSFEGDESARKKINYYKGYARRLIETYVQLCPETASDDTILNQLAESAAGKVLGDSTGKTHAGIFYNPNHAGESSSKPTCRQPPLRQGGDHLKRLSNIVFRLRKHELADNDLWFIFDGGREGVRSINIQPNMFRTAQKHVGGPK